MARVGRRGSRLSGLWLAAGRQRRRPRKLSRWSPRVGAGLRRRQMRLLDVGHRRVMARCPASLVVERAIWAPTGQGKCRRFLCLVGAGRDLQHQEWSPRRRLRAGEGLGPRTGRDDRCATGRGSGRDTALGAGSCSTRPGWCGLRSCAYCRLPASCQASTALRRAACAGSFGIIANETEHQHDRVL